MSNSFSELSAEKREMLAQLLKQEGFVSPEVSAIPRLGAGEAPLSHAQQRLWFLDQLQPGNSAYHLPSALRLKGKLNVTALEEAINQIVKRHGALRTTFRTIGDRTFQVIAEFNPTRIPVVELGDHGKTADEIVTQEIRRPFSLTEGPLFRAKLVRFSEEDHVLVVVMHHIISDGWSYGVFFRELSAFYEAFINDATAQLPEPDIQYADFTAWEANQEQSESLQSSLSYWKQQLTGAPEQLALPADFDRPARQTFRGALASLDLDKDLLDALRKLDGREDATLYMTTLAAFYVLLRRYSGQQDIVLGTPIAGRNRTETQNVIGFFVNTLALRLQLQDSVTFRELMSSVKGVLLDAFNHPDIPLDKIVDALQLKRNLSYTPLIQVFFNLFNFGASVELAGLEVSDFKLDNLDSKFDLTFYVIQEDDKAWLSVVYNRDLFSAERIQEMLRQFAMLLRQVAENPDRLIGDYDLAAGNVALPNPKQSLPIQPQQTVLEGFAQQANIHAGKTAVSDSHGSWSYQELECRSNQLARQLIFKGVRAHDVVAIYGSRNASLVWAILAAMKTGATISVLDKAYPAERIVDYLSTLMPKTWLIVEDDGEVPEEVDAFLDVISCSTRIHVSRKVAVEEEDLAYFPGSPVSINIQGNDAAYIVFTSGSTGKPNAVVTPHNALSHFLEWQAAEFKLTADDNFSMFSGLTHDPVFRDVFAPLSVGATLYIPDRENMLVPQLIRRWVQKHEISVIHLTPALLGLLTADAQPGGQLKSLRYVFSGGDVLSKELVSHLEALAPQAQCINFYGTSETPQAMAYHRAKGAVAVQNEAGKSRVPIGRGIDQVQLLVLNKDRQLAGVGELGEIYVRTPYLSLGYLGQDGLTSERFITNPFTKVIQDRIYRTGDLGRYTPDGEVEYHGRADHQIKIRGHRVEPAEIERVLLTHSAIERVVVCAKEDAASGLILAAYFVPVKKGNQDSMIESLRQLVRSSLPEYMVPAVFIPVDRVPMTPNNKIEYRALPWPVANIPAVLPALPNQTALEQQLSSIWRQVLPAVEFNTQANFFDVGGNSLLLVRVHQRIQKTLKKEISLIDLFQYPTIHSLAEFLEGNAASEPALPRMGRGENERSSSAIAIIGVAGRFPGAKDVGEYWRNLCDGVESIQFFSDTELRQQGVDEDSIADPAFVKAGAVLSGMEEFDAGFFGVNPREAESMDPQHRLFLECAWQALESAGYVPESPAGPIGVFAGASASTYLYGNLLTNQRFLDAVGGFSTSILHGNEKDYLPTRVSYKLGLKGPSMAVQTACSTSLVAVSRACQSLLNGECNMAMAGGVSVNVWQSQGYMYESESILSPDGHCRAFDAEARGTVFGSGVGVVALKKLADALQDGDNVLAVIKGFATNNDGAMKIGFTAPSVEGQAAVIREALANAGVEAESIGYVEAHGTGTSLGDPIEIAALTKAYSSVTTQQSCAIGSVKTNIGHLNAAAGVAGLIKAALAVKEGVVPASLHYQKANGEIDFANSPFYVNDRLRKWEANEGPRRAGVSSFGIGGTNAHVILEEAPRVWESSASREKQLLVVSGRNEKALQEAAENLSQYLQSGELSSLGDVAYTLAVGRKGFQQRMAVVCGSVEEAIEGLREGKGRGVVRGAWKGQAQRVAMLLSGQGSQYVQMGKQLYEQERVFREVVDRSSEYLQPLLGLDLRQVMFAQGEEEKRAAELLRQTWLTQPALYVLEWALLQQWESWGIKASVMLGHSLGEIVAARAAGVFGEEEGLRLVAERGRLMWETEAGAMLSAVMSEAEAEQYVRANEGIWLAAVNGKQQVVFSGGEKEIVQLEEKLAEKETIVKRLAVERAFHSGKMEKVKREYLEVVKKLKLQEPGRRYVSNVTGTWAGAEVTEAEYWWEQMRQPVRYGAGVELIAGEGEWIWLEVGPGETLARLTGSELRRQGKSGSVISSLSGEAERKREQEKILRTLGEMWCQGVEIDWKGYFQDERRRRLSLPTYPFQRQRYWVEAGHENASSTKTSSIRKKTDIADWFYVPTWKRSVPAAALNAEKPNVLSASVVFASENELDDALIQNLQNAGLHPWIVKAGDVFAVEGEKSCCINPDRAQDYVRLLEHMRRAGFCPDSVFHLWLLKREAAHQDHGFYSLLFLAQAHGEIFSNKKINVVVAANGLHEVTGREILEPSKATVLGACRVIPQENSNIAIRCIDFASNDAVDPEKSAAYLIAEAKVNDAESVLAYRNGHRWAQSFEAVRLNAGNATIKDGGVYLITGGLGGVGLVLAEHLASNKRVKLVLTGRSSFPERESWDSWIEGHGADDPVTRKIAKLKELETSGSAVMVCHVDVTNREEMEKVFAQVRAQYGRISGVIHAAGIAGGGMADLKAKKTAAEVIAPKLEGTLILAELLSEDKPDFFALCSSRAAVIGGAGQIDYCAANNFLDAFAHHNTQSTGVLTVSIDWGAWQETGMAVNAVLPDALKAERKASLHFAIAPREATIAFDRILASGLSQVVVSPQDLAALMDQSKPAEIKELEEIHSGHAEPAVVTGHERPNITAQFRAPANSIEQQIAGMWEQVLGVTPVGINDDFLELGGHSLLATQLISKIRTKFDVGISLRTFFARPTVSALAEIIGNESAGSPTGKESALLIKRVARDESLPLSFAQQRLWLLDQLQPGNAAYNISSAVRLTGRLDLAALQCALTEIVRRHETLRTTFAEVDGRAVQVIGEAKAQELIARDLSMLPEAEKSAQVESIIANEAKAPFDLAKGPLFRSTLIRLDDQIHVLQLTFHHIISDGWSTGVLIRELAEAYNAGSARKPTELSELVIGYADYSVWQRSWLTGDVLQKQLDFWKNHLQGAPAVLALPLDHPRPSVQTHRGATEYRLISAEMQRALQEESRKHGVTLFILLLAAFKVLVSRYSGQKDIVIGCPIAGRNRSELEGLIGFFANMLVLRTDLEGEPTFRDLVQRVRENCLSAYSHSDLPFEMLIDALAVERNLSHTPLFQTVFVLQNAPRHALKLQDLEVEYLPINTDTAKYDLNLTMQESPEGLMTWFEYNADLFDAVTVQRMMAHLETLLVGVVANPDSKVSQLPLISADELKTFITPAISAQPGASSIAKWFEAQVAKDPEAPALSFEKQRLTYRELNEHSNRLAHYLAARGVAAGDCVGIYLDRSVEMLVSILAVLKAGAAYVPMDTAYPKDRLNFIIEDSGVSAFITDSRLTVVAAKAEQRIELDREQGAIAQQSSQNPVWAAQSADVAYVIYTSGSTGKPKGVLVTHGNVVRLMRATENWFHFSKEDVWTLFHSFAFDFSVWEIWGALLYGGRLVVVPYWISRSPEDFCQLLMDEGVTVLNQTPSAFQQLIKAEAESGASPKALSLRYVIFGGEALDLSSLKPWFARHGDRKPQLINMYGITETTVHVTYRPISEADLSLGGRSVIGETIPDLQLHILDEHLQPIPVGVAGEIFVGGEGVARAYLNRPALTAERFVPNPFTDVPGARLYRSGDLARRLNNGDHEYLGRADHQVKIRGFRIELGEIEAALCTHAEIRQALVIARQSGEGDKQLVAYIVTAPSAVVTPAYLRSHLKGSLPDYMVPSSFIQLEKFPLTSHGKIDRRALPEPSSIVDEEYVAPATPLEYALAEIWEQVLGAGKISTSASFFALGGDSIRAIQVRASARARGIQFSLQDLFQHQTIRELAARVEQTSGNHYDPIAISRISILEEVDRNKLPADVEDAYPLTMLQAGMVFHSELEPESAVYHDIFSYLIRAAFDHNKFSQALALVAACHPVLRTSIDLKNYSKPLQLVHRKVDVPFNVEDLRSLPEQDQERAIDKWIEQEKGHPFDWNAAPLFRFHAHRRSEETFQLTFSFHHAILDGWSVASLLTELLRCYSDLLLGKKVQLAAPAVSFGEFVQLEQSALESSEMADFWERKLEGAAATLLPSRESAHADKAREVVSRRVDLPGNISDRVRELAKECAVPLKTVLLAAHVNVLGTVSGQTDVMTGLVSNGRPEEAGGERALGLFLNTVPLRASISGGAWTDLVTATFAAETEQMPFRRYPMAKIQDINRGQPLFNTVFNFVHFHVYDKLDDGPNLKVLGAKAFEETNFPLVANFSLLDNPDQVRLNLLYDPAILSAEQVERIAGYYHRCLSAMALEPHAQYEVSSLLATEERDEIKKWSSGPVASSSLLNVVELFQQQAKNAPDRLAISSHAIRLTYHELDKRTSGLARVLKQHGVAVGSRVGICVSSGAEMVIGALAVLKAGGAYLPIDKAYPTERQHYMLANSGAQVFITSGAKNMSVPFGVIQVDLASCEIKPGSNEATKTLVFAEDLAYTIYTSGSTGQPKGVGVSHRGLMNLVRWHQQIYNVTPSDRATQIASLGFDASVWEIWPYLTVGASLHFADDDTRLSIKALTRWMADEEITISFLPTPLAESVLQEPLLGTTKLRFLLTGGDRLRQGPREGLPFQLINHYGPTENAVVATFAAVSAGQSNPPIGKPIANVTAYVLNPFLQLCPAGAAGELFISGESLAQGYTNDPALTAARFLPDPFSEIAGSRMYRTGDLVRWLPDGQLEFLGRIDQQVKIHGHRIELGEIEAALKSQPRVSGAAVEVRHDLNGDPRLVGYIVVNGDAAGVEAEIRLELANHLPGYMVPGLFVLLQQMPLTSHGKIDRKALPTPEWHTQAFERKYIAPRTPLEIQIAQIWAESLGVPQIGLLDNFFIAGGDSLKAIRAMSRLNNFLEMDLPLRLLFDSPDVEAFAAAVVQHQVNAGDADLAAILAELDEMTEDEAVSMLSSELQR